MKNEGKTLSERKIILPAKGRLDSYEDKDIVLYPEENVKEKVQEFIDELKEEFDNVMQSSKNHKEANLKFIRIRSWIIDNLALKKFGKEILKEQK